MALADLDPERAYRNELLDACRIVVDYGFTPVNTKAYERLRDWLDLVGWPPKERGKR